MMARTADRPVASGRISPARRDRLRRRCSAAPPSLLLALTVNPLAAALSLSGLLGYVFVYTLWLKRTTPQNIVIGGAAGAVPPLVAWAAVTGGLSGMAFYLFAIVFFWTPPHFWALSLLMKDEYAKAGIPMLPVVRGEDETRRQILLYTVLLYAVTQLPFCAGGLGIAYLVPSMLLGAAFIDFAVHAAAQRRPPPGRCAPTSSRSPTWRCCSSRWRSPPTSRRAGWLTGFSVVGVGVPIPKTVAQSGRAPWVRSVCSLSLRERDAHPTRRDSVKLPGVGSFRGGRC